MSDSKHLLNERSYQPSPEQVFPSYFTAFRLLNPDNGIRYHPFINFIFTPAPELNEECLFDFFHEFAHAQLQNGVLGLTLQLLHKLPAPIEKLLFGEIWERMSALQLAGDMQKRLFKELFLFGAPRTIDMAEVQSAIGDSSVREFYFLLTGAAFRDRWSVFELIGARRKALHTRWKILHEGFATAMSIEIARGETEFGCEIRQRLTTSLFPEAGANDHQALFSAVAKLADSVRHRKVSVTTPHSSYTKGFRMIERLRLEHRSAFVAMVAVLAASHFSYPSFPILDVSTPVFDSWLSGALNPLQRLAHLIENPHLLKPFGSSELTPEELPSLMVNLIRSFPNYAPQSGMTFGEWAVTHLWGSPLYSSVFDTPPLQCAKSSLDDYQRLFSEDRSEVFVHGEFFIPTLLLPDGTVRQDDIEVRRGFFGNFVDFYEIERTSRLLSTLSSVCDVPVPQR